MLAEELAELAMVMVPKALVIVRLRFDLDGSRIQRTGVVRNVRSRESCVRAHVTYNHSGDVEEYITLERLVVLKCPRPH